MGRERVCACARVRVSSDFPTLVETFLGFTTFRGIGILSSTERLSHALLTCECEAARLGSTGGYRDPDFDQILVDFGVNLASFWASLAAILV